MKKKIGNIIVSSICCVLLPYWGGTQNKIETRVSKNTVAVGEMFRIEFIAKENCKFAYPDMSAFDVLSGPNQSTSQSMTIINGQMQKEYTIKHNFVLRPKKKGNFVIDPCVLKCSGNNHQSEPIRIQVVDANEAQSNTANNKNWFGKVQTSKSSVYIGEPVVATYKIYSRVNIADLSELSYGESQGWYKKEIDPKTTLQLQQETYNGIRYYMVELKKDLLFAQHSGDVTVPEFNIDAVFRRSFFESFRDQIRSNNATLKVKPLPETGKPENYSGAVGKFSYKAELSKTELEVGEAIDLTITIEGSGNLTLFTPTPPELPETFEIYDPEVDEKTKLTYQGISGKITYNYLMVPQRPGDFDIPPLEFSYFNPKSKRYEIIQTDGFLIKVNGDLTTTDPTTYSPVKKEIEAQPTFRHISKSSISKTTKDNLVFNTPTFWVMSIAPLLLSIFLLIWNPKRKTGNATESSEKLVKKRMKKAYQLLAENDLDAYYTEIINTIYVYLSEKLNIKGAELNKATIKEKLIELNEESLAQKLNQLLEEVEYAQYAGQSNEAGAKVAEETKELLSTITHKLKNKSR